MERKLASLLVLALLVSTACGSGARPPGSASPGGTSAPAGTGGDGAIGLALAHVPRASASPADAAEAATAINAFGLDVFRRVGAAGGNVVISPASIALALAMARAGARGETATQMDTVLRSVGSDDRAAGINALAQALEGVNGAFKDAAGDDLQVTLRIANAPFAQEGVTWKAAFLEALAARFAAGLRLVDYSSDPESARRLINGWVSDRTEQRIPELLANGVLDNLTRLVLVNAIYLKAPWLNPFEEGQTRPGPFLRADGSTVEAQMMSLHAALPYATGEGWRAVQLPYVGDSLALTVIVPDQLTAFEKGLTPEALEAIVESLAPTQVRLAFPRFGMETQADLAGTLQALGMPLAFDPDRADFSGMTDQERLSISSVIHQANIDVDEKGTEAAAATAVVMRTTAAPAEPVALQVDRPFLFALRDTRTGAILFLGRVSDPTTR